MGNIMDHLRFRLNKPRHRQAFLNIFRYSLVRDLPAHEIKEIIDRMEVRPREDGLYDVIVDGALPPHLLSAVNEASFRFPDMMVKFLPKKPVRHVGDAPSSNPTTPPQFGERILLLVLRTKEERANIPGDLEEEFKQIAAKHGARYAKLWYYKQVVASAWPMMRKAVGWGLLATIGTWIRRVI